MKESFGQIISVRSFFIGTILPNSTCLVLFLHILQNYMAVDFGLWIIGVILDI